ncbi:MAG: hypothetical protein AB1689_06845 [Thermodesulfobacteriota bacterium]
MKRDESETSRRQGRGRRVLGWLGSSLVVAKLAVIGLSLHGTLAGAAPADGEQGAPRLAVVPPREPAAPTAPAPGEAAGKPSPPDVKSILGGLVRRQQELDAREQAVAARELQLAVYEKDVGEKIAQLEALGKSLKEQVTRANAASDEAAASLAKVYGAMKPAEAAPLLDQLDEATALRILTRMKEKQVGEILPLMSRERAIGLTRSLAGRAAPPPAQAQGS